MSVTQTDDPEVVTDGRNIEHLMDGRDATLEVESLESVTHGAVVSITGAVGQKGILFLTNLLLTHSLGVGAYGLYGSCSVCSESNPAIDSSSGSSSPATGER